MGMELEELKTAQEDFFKSSKEFMDGLDTRMKEIEEKGFTSAGTEEKVDKLNESVSKAEDAIKKAEEEYTKFQERIETVEASLDRPGGTPAPGDGEQSDKHVAFMDWARHGLMDMEKPERKLALIVSDDTTGGYFASPEIVQELIRGITEITPALQIATVRQTSRRTMIFRKKTGTHSASRVGEIATRVETPGTKFGQEEITMPEMYSLVLISQQDLEDADFPLEQEIKDEMVEQHNVKIGVEFITGIGTPANQMEGILSNAAVIASPVVTGDADEITADGLLDLIYELKTGYIQNATILANRATIKIIRKLSFTSGEYMWQPGALPTGQFSGLPATIENLPYIECPDMPDVAANSLPIAVGDFKKAYKIGIRINMTMQRLVEKYSDQGEVGLKGRMRVGGQVVLAEAIKVQKVST